jgi:hypothetical protein
VFPYRASAGGRYNTTGASLATRQGRVVRAMTGCHGGHRCAQITFPRNTPSTTGAYGGLYQRISGGRDGPKTLTFWQTDDYGGTTAGYRYL